MKKSTEHKIINIDNNDGSKTHADGIEGIILAIGEVINTIILGAKKDNKNMK